MPDTAGAASAVVTGGASTSDTHTYCHAAARSFALRLPWPSLPILETESEFELIEMEEKIWWM